jgi:hypothetical protein
VAAVAPSLLQQIQEKTLLPNRPIHWRTLYFVNTLQFWLKCSFRERKMLIMDL